MALIMVSINIYNIRELAGSLCGAGSNKQASLNGVCVLVRFSTTQRALPEIL